MYLEGYSCLVASVLDSDIIVNVFELQSGYNVHFQTYTLAKGTNSFIFQTLC